jgi:hypothetical protein
MPRRPWARSVALSTSRRELPARAARQVWRARHPGPLFLSSSNRSRLLSRESRTLGTGDRAAGVSGFSGSVAGRLSIDVGLFLHVLIRFGGRLSLIRAPGQIVALTLLTGLRVALRSRTWPCPLSKVAERGPGAGVLVARRAANRDARSPRGRQAGRRPSSRECPGADRRREWRSPPMAPRLEGQLTERG